MDNIISILMATLIALGGLANLPIAFNFFTARKFIYAIGALVWSAVLFYVAFKSLNLS